MRDWLDDSDVIVAIRGEKRTHNEMMNEEPSISHQVNDEVLQTGRGEVDDNERPFYVESVRQVNTKKFRTKAMAPNRLTTECILAEFERIIQSNKEFRLNDTIEINVIHVSMPTGQRHQTLGSEFGETFGKEEIYHKNTKRGWTLYGASSGSRQSQAR